MGLRVTVKRPVGYCIFAHIVEIMSFLSILLWEADPCRGQFLCLLESFWGWPTGPWEELEKREAGTFMPHLLPAPLLP